MTDQLSPSYEVLLSPTLARDFPHQQEDLAKDQQLVTANTETNIILLSLLLALGLTANLLAFPVIMFRRTRFGNGQFAVLMLCLTLADLLSLACGLAGGLLLELGHMAWVGDSVGCQIYYFLSAWLMGLANYLVVVLTGLLHVKRSTSWLARLQECRALLLLLTATTLLPALPEFLVRATISLDAGLSVCIIAVGPIPYGFYTGLKLLVLLVLPLLLVAASLLWPQTKVARRLSALFLGEGAACECGPGGQENKLPHECPMIDRPDLVTSHQRHTMVSSSGRGPACTKLLPTREDPHRRRYKRLMALSFLWCSSLQFVLDLALQLQSGAADQWEQAEVGADLATAILVPTYLQQVINPLLLVYVEFSSN